MPPVEMVKMAVEGRGEWNGRNVGMDCMVITYTA